MNWSKGSKKGFTNQIVLIRGNIDMPCVKLIPIQGRKKSIDNREKAQ